MPTACRSWRHLQTTKNKRSFTNRKWTKAAFNSISQTNSTTIIKGKQDTRLAKMAKGGGKNNGGVQNRAIYSRVSFLQQAAVFLSRQSQSQHQQQQQALQPSTSSALAPLVPPPTSLEGMSRRLATDLRSVSLKTRIRLSPAVKRTICKYCDSVLIDGSTCTAFIENRSKGGRKPWADILVRRCHACKKERRYPIEAKRTKRKTERGIAGEDAAGGDAMEVDGPPVAGKGKGQKQKQKQSQGQTEVEVGEQKG